MKTVNLETAKKLHDAGIEVESERWWIIGDGRFYGDPVLANTYIKDDKRWGVYGTHEIYEDPVFTVTSPNIIGVSSTKDYPAPDAQELLNYILSTHKINVEIDGSIITVSIHNVHSVVSDESLPEALASLTLKLKKEKIV